MHSQLQKIVYILKTYLSIHQFLEPIRRNLMILLFHKYVYDF